MKVTLSHKQTLATVVAVLSMPLVCSSTAWLTQQYNKLVNRAHVKCIQKVKALRECSDIIVMILYSVITVMGVIIYSELFQTIYSATSKDLEIDSSPTSKRRCQETDSSASASASDDDAV